MKTVLANRLSYPPRDVGRIDEDDISADRLELIHEFRPPDDVDGLQAARLREGDHPPPDSGIGGILRNPVTRFHLDEIAGGRATLWAD